MINSSIKITPLHFPFLMFHTHGEITPEIVHLRNVLLNMEKVPLMTTNFGKPRLLSYNLPNFVLMNLINVEEK